MAGAELPMRWVSIDPGDRHVGFAAWHDADCMYAIELTPDQCVTALMNMAIEGVLHHVVYEKFALYGWNEKSMAGNEFETVQLIGKIKLICDIKGISYSGQFAREHKAIYRMGWYKALTAKEKRKLPWWGHGGHAMDAWVIGMWFKRQREAA